MRQGWIWGWALLFAGAVLVGGCGQKVSPTGPFVVGADQGGNPDGWGEHNGEVDALSVRIDYLDTYFWTEDGLAGYYIGYPAKIQVTLTNESNRNFDALDLRTTVEYADTGCQDRWWYPDPETGETWVCVEEGQQAPGDTQWVDSEFSLGAGESAQFVHTYTIPYETVAGNSWVHVEMRHSNTGPWHAAKFYDNPRQSLFDPPPLE